MMAINSSAHHDDIADIGVGLNQATVAFPADEPLHLDSGKTLGPFTIAYNTYGSLNAAKTNAILICHALTGDQHVANRHPLTEKVGWWSELVGPGKPIDTDRYFVICPNILGGCLGSTGPASINPETGAPYGLKFPVITIGDMVAAQHRLIDHLGIDQLFAVLGGSMGGMQVLEWASRYKDRVFAALADRHGGLALLPEHRLSRSWPAGCDGGS